MTQQPYYPQQQGYPPQQPQYPQQMQPQFPGYPPQQFQQPQAPPYAGPQQPPAPPLAEGSLDAFYSQPSAGGGPSLSWTDKNRQPKPIGTSYIGVVARDVTNADVQQQTDFNTKAPLYYRDGRPKFAMKVPLKVQPSQEFPDGEASWYVKGQARDELVRAMSEAGVDGSPKAGALIQVTLVQRQSSGAGLNPRNVVQVVYRPDASGQVPQQQPVQQIAPQQGADAPSQAPAPQMQGYGQPQYGQQPAYDQGQQFPGAPSPAPGIQQPVQQGVQQPAFPQGQPAQQQGGQQMPPGFTAEQQELFARISGQQAQ